MRSCILALVLPLAAGCAAGPSVRPQPQTAAVAELGRAHKLPLRDPLEVNGELAYRVLQEVGQHGSPDQRALELLRWLRAEKKRFAYAEGESYTAAEAFQARRGDCFAVTNLFVALARLLGIDARYAYVREGEYRDQDGRFVISTHVAAVYGRGRDERIVDFIRDPDARNLYLYQPLTDGAAAALFNSNLAVQQLQRGHADIAEAMLRLLLEREPELPELQANLGAVLLHQKRAREARALLDAALGRFPAYAPLYANAIAADLALGDDASARAHQERARAIADGDPLLVFGEGLRRYEHQDYAAASERFQRAASLLPSSASVWAWLARAQHADGHAGPATESLERALRLAPQDAQLRALASLLRAGAPGDAPL